MDDSVASVVLKRTQVEQRDPFEELFLRYYNLVYQVALRVLGNLEEAEDVTQDVFLKLYRVWPKLRIKVSLKAWLCRVALNACYSRLRTSARDRRALVNEALDTVVNRPGDAVATEQAAARQEIYEVLSKISLRDRTLIFLKHFGFSYQEIADVLGVRAGSVGTLIARAQQRYKKAHYTIYGGGNDEM